MSSRTAVSAAALEPVDSRGGWDRLIVGLLLFVILVVAATVFMGTIGVVSLSGLPWGAWIDRAIRAESLPNGLGPLVVGASSAVVGLLSAVMLLGRLAPRTRSELGSHVLVADERGFVVVDKQGISTVAATAATRVHGVIDAHVRVVGSGAAPVRLLIRARVHAGADLKRAGDEARQRAVKAVEDLVGLEVQDAVVRITVVPLEELDRIIE